MWPTCSRACPKPLDPGLIQRMTDPAEIFRAHAAARKGESDLMEHHLILLESLNRNEGTLAFRLESRSQACYLIGRDPSCSFVMDDSSIEPIHASLLVHDREVEVWDLGTGGKTAVNGIVTERAPWRRATCSAWGTASSASACACGAGRGSPRRATSSPPGRNRSRAHPAGRDRSHPDRPRRTPCHASQSRGGQAAPLAFPQDRETQHHHLPLTHEDLDHRGRAGHAHAGQNPRRRPPSPPRPAPSPPPRRRFSCLRPNIPTSA